MHGENGEVFKLKYCLWNSDISSSTRRCASVIWAQAEHLKIWWSSLLIKDGINKTMNDANSFNDQFALFSHSCETFQNYLLNTTSSIYEWENNLIWWLCNSQISRHSNKWLIREFPYGFSNFPKHNKWENFENRHCMNRDRKTYMHFSGHEYLTNLDGVASALLPPSRYSSRLKQENQISFKKSWNFSMIHFPHKATHFSWTRKKGNICEINAEVMTVSKCFTWNGY